MTKLNEHIIEKENNTYKIKQHKNGMYMVTRMNVHDDNDISNATRRTMGKIFDWIDEQETI